MTVAPPPPHSPPPPPGLQHSQEVVVTGGAGGVTAQLDALHSASDLLLETADVLETVLARLLLAQFDLGALGGTLSPVTAVRAEAASGRFALAAVGVDVRLRGTALGVRTSVHAYETAEALVTRSFDLAVAGAGMLVGAAVRSLVLSPTGMVLLGGAAAVLTAAATALPAMWRGAETIGLVDAIDSAYGIDTAALVEQGVDAATAWVGEAGAAAVHWAGENPRLTEAVIEHGLPGFWRGLAGMPPSSVFAPVSTEVVPTDSRALTGLLLVGASRLGHFGDQSLRPWHRPAPSHVREVRGADRAAPASAAAPGSVSELWQRQWTRSRGLDNGQVRVEQVRSGGQSRWIVYVPATTSGALRPGTATSDMTSNLESVSGRRSAQHTTVREAMRRAGVPKGDPVMMVGYSQGGIVASSLVEDEEFRADYDVDALFTVGSPISDFQLPAEVDVLSVEHRQDLVPLLDGDANPDRAHWTTVNVDLDVEAQAQRLADGGKSAQEIERQLSAPLYAHGGELYTHTIADLESGGPPEVADWAERNGGFFSGSVESTHDFVGERR